MPCMGKLGVTGQHFNSVAIGESSSDWPHLYPGVISAGSGFPLSLLIPAGPDFVSLHQLCAVAIQ